MPSIELKNIAKNICLNVNLRIHDGELLVFVGPTGAGKTTLLNVIAGIDQYNGSVFLDGKSADSLTPDKRGIGYLFQGLALFPHLDVASNVAYGLKVQKMRVDEREARVRELLEFLSITDLRERYPKDLSGGERQRVALARALAPSPGILLLDEPLSSLDPTISKYLRMELRRIIKEMEITAVYVTHDLKEAEEMADRMALIHHGQIQQVSRPRDMIFSSESETVSSFLGRPNILECDYSKILEQGLIEFRCGGMSMFLPYEGKGIKKVAIFPGDIYVSVNEPPGPGINRFKGSILGLELLSSVARLKIKVEDNTLFAELPIEIFKQMDLKPGQEIFLILKLRRLRYYAATEN
ncbi:MAG: ABC transporter ATP-binding protein [Thermodesulfobacteriota bacterium]